MLSSHTRLLLLYSHAASPFCFLSLFSSSSPPPPRSTPFPYTTLFRSKRENFLPTIELLKTRLDVLHVQARLQQDRKSTRLNSIHLGISYAVFCLKKKKKKKKIKKNAKKKKKTNSKYKNK